jgi:hypothetical protein
MAEQAKRPVLSEGDLNKHLAGLSEKDLKGAAHQIKPPGGPLNRGALEAWVRSHFALTKDQEEHLRNLPDADKGAIERAAEAVEKGGKKVTVRFVPAPARVADEKRKVTVKCHVEITVT